MTLFITNIGMSLHNKRSIPAVVNITFSNGEKCTYERRGDKITSSGNQLAQFRQPKYDFSEEKTVEHRTFEALRSKFSLQLRSLDQQYKSAVEEAERLSLLEKESIDELCDRRRRANDELLSTVSKEMLGCYKSVKKEIDRKMKTLDDPLQRIEIITRWLREIGSEELAKTAIMLEHESDYIVARLNAPRNQWSCFLSHVQAKSTDLSRLIKDNLEKKGIPLWLDKAADRVDLHGMVDGIVDSSSFMIVLTKDYVKRRYCVFEYCVAAVAEKPVITVLEPDERFGGGPIKSFEFVGLFKHLLDHEIIEVRRKHWEGFVENLHRRITRTLQSRSLRGNRSNIHCRSVRGMGRNALKIRNFSWDEKKIHPHLTLDGDMVTLSSRRRGWASAVGLQELGNGRQKFSLKMLEVSMVCTVIVGVVQQGFDINTKIGRNNSGWGWSGVEARSEALHAGSADSYGEAYSAGDVVTIELDMGKQITCYKNGISQGVAFRNVAGPVFPAVSLSAEGCVQLMSV